MVYLLKILGWVKNIFKLTWAHKHITVYILLALTIMFMYHHVVSLKNNIFQLKGNIEELKKNQIAIINGNEVISKDKNGKPKKEYVPREGQVIIEKNPLTNDVIIKVKNKGLTSKIGASFIYDGNYNDQIIKPALDMKLLYWNRYSSGIGTTWDSPFLFVSRHLDDLIPVIKPENIELELIYGRNYNDFGHSVFGIGLRTNL